MANEKRLIVASELAKRVYGIGIYFCGLRNGKTLLKEAMEKYRDAVLRAICECTTVDAEPVVHAKWVLVGDGMGSCSNCHRLDYIDTLATHCRYCGAKIDGERRMG